MLAEVKTAGSKNCTHCWAWVSANPPGIKDYVTHSSVMLLPQSCCSCCCGISQWESWCVKDARFVQLALFRVCGNCMHWRWRQRSTWTKPCSQSSQGGTFPALHQHCSNNLASSTIPEPNFLRYILCTAPIFQPLFLIRKVWPIFFVHSAPIPSWTTPIPTRKKIQIPHSQPQNRHRWGASFHRAPPLCVSTCLLAPAALYNISHPLAAGRAYRYIHIQLSEAYSTWLQNLRTEIPVVNFQSKRVKTWLPRHVCHQIASLATRSSISKCSLFDLGNHQASEQRKFSPEGSKVTRPGPLESDTNMVL